MSPPLLSLRDATVQVGAKVLFAGLSLAIGKGDRICLVGRNGSGKSTTVSMIAALLEPSGGKVLLDGIDVRSDLIAYKASIGYVPEEAVLYSYLTGPEYLALIGGLRGIPAHTVQDRIDGFLTAL